MPEDKQEYSQGAGHQVEKKLICGNGCKLRLTIHNADSNREVYTCPHCGFKLVEVVK